MCAGADPTIFMKTNNLVSRTYDVHENKGSCALKRGNLVGVPLVGAQFLGPPRPDRGDTPWYAPTCGPSRPHSLPPARDFPQLGRRLLRRFRTLVVCLLLGFLVCLG